MKPGRLFPLVCLCSVLALPAVAGVWVTSPASGSTSGSPVHFVATSTSPGCRHGVASMGIYTQPGVLAYVVNGANLNTYLNMNSGTYNVVVQEWDNCGWSAKAPITLTVGSGGGSGGKTFNSLQHSGGWTGYALLPPGYGICGNCSPSGPQAIWWWDEGVGSPSMDGISTRAYYGGGQVRYADILWNNHLIGDFSSQGLPDHNHTLVPKLHNFTYDVYFWIANASQSQALEFDINQFVNGGSYIWGHECRIAGGNEWDTWNNQTQHWVPSGVPCKPLPNAWNHLTLSVQRTSDGHLLFHSITLNGNTNVLDRYDWPTSSGWYGVTVNYQMDSDYSKTPYSVYLDKFTFSAW